MKVYRLDDGNLREQFAPTELLESLQFEKLQHYNVEKELCYQYNVILLIQHYNIVTSLVLCTKNERTFEVELSLHLVSEVGFANTPTGHQISRWWTRLWKN